MKAISKFFILFLFTSFIVSCAQPQGEKVELGETKDVNKEAMAQAKELKVDLATSEIYWEGAKVTTTHFGIIKMKSGSLNVDAGKIVGGEFTFDMSSIEAHDLEGDDRKKLETKLKGTDFFDIEQFPEGKFQITSVKEQAGEAGTNQLVEGNLTIRGISKGIKFPATINLNENGEVKATTPQFTFDRQEFGITIKGMTDNAINDLVGIKITLNAK